jgi:hypothetical protein
MISVLNSRGSCLAWYVVCQVAMLTCQHVLVIGPGLGRDDHMQTCARIALSLAKEQDGMGVVVDADGLFLVAVRLVVTGGGRADGVERPDGRHGLARCPSRSSHSQRHGVLPAV